MVRVAAESTVVLHDGTVFGCGNICSSLGGSSQLQRLDMGLEGRVVIDVSVGSNFIVVMLDDYSLWSVGNGDRGQLGTGRYSTTCSFIQCY